MKLWYARRQLLLAIRDEESARTYANSLRIRVIPSLERELQKAEIDLLCAERFKK